MRNGFFAKLAVTNLRKNRQKELALYQVLGMEKGHLSALMFLETLFSGAAGWLLGIAAGILGSKLALLLFLKILHVPAQFGFAVYPEAIAGCAAFCVLTGTVTLFVNVRRGSV